MNGICSSDLCSLLSKLNTRLFWPQDSSCLSSCLPSFLYLFIYLAAWNLTSNLAHA